ncbi:hypothetical protein CEUSTIGMA_g7829.t1 [Chlamydomonas eustigma]|uniref:Methyltransferase FkbM domain-containing protein n=1 Tax=Chlamydomonas eustigma TaxID=1157962 RepID=A0A250XCA4_9CHLO|nr:hypothetical protein CEUSTIGMA_g7829.t1 [Chlamydomonas eustigma]|eukprot:GAX80390.1 hypothetical protein CEUSTIGMA_g7829.t1 [Chlamydomonas eustigma]
MRSFFHVVHLHLLPLTQQVVIVLLCGCVGIHAKYSCEVTGSGEPMSCSGWPDDREQDTTTRKLNPSTLFLSCLLDRLPFPFFTSVVNLTLQLPYYSSDMIHCQDPKCATTAQWNAALHHPDDDAIVSKSFLYKNGAEGFENVMKTHFLRYLKTQPQDVTVLDVGANIGVHSLWFAALGYKVHSFEPLSKNFALLHCSVILTPNLQANIRVNNFGLSTRNSTACMLSESHNLGGTHAEVLDSDNIYNGSHYCAPEDRASMRTLDWYWITVLNKEPVFLMKIDVEGFEPQVVAGGHQMFTQSPPKVLILEFVAQFILRAGGSARSFLSRLESLGYAHCDPWTNVCIPVTMVHTVWGDLLLVHKTFREHISQVSGKSAARDHDDDMLDHGAHVAGYLGLITKGLKP